MPCDFVEGYLAVQRGYDQTRSLIIAEQIAKTEAAAALAQAQK